MSKLSTKNIPASTMPKTLSFGNCLATINNLTLGPGYSEGAYHLILHLEGPELGDDFEGLFVDKNNESLGRYYGQVARVKFRRFDFSDGEHNGRTFSRDAGILRAIRDLANELNVIDRVDQIEADTIEEIVEAAAPIICNGEYLNFCIAGREYVNAEGYTNYDLYLPPGTQRSKAFEHPDVEPDKSKLIKFNKAEHILVKSDTPAVKSFGSAKPGNAAAPAGAATGGAQPGAAAPAAGTSGKKPGIRSDFDFD